MRKVLIVVDMQNDFITGALANTEGQKITTKIADFIRNFDGDIIATRDTHTNNYINTLEGRKLPVPHCIEGTEGWDIVPEVQKALDERENVRYVDKATFGSLGLFDIVGRKLYSNVELVGVCTDICVISNAMILKAMPELKVAVHKDLCAGVTPESHENALKAMASCQIDII